jgi:hypothetical protein
MHKSIILVAALAASGLVAEPAWAKIIKFEATVSQVRAACSQANGTFGVHVDGGGYGCVKKNCDGKGGNCEVQCSNNNGCTGQTPGRVQPGYGIGGILIPSAKPSKADGILSTGILESGPVLGTSGPAATGSPAGGKPTAAPSAPPVIIR